MSVMEYWVWLSTRPGVDSYTARLLLEAFGTPEAIWAAGRERLEETRLLQRGPGIESLMDKSLDGVKRLMDTCYQKGINLLSPDDTLYPALLRSIPAPPVVLYTKGRMPYLDERLSAAIIGTRKATAYGIAVSEKLGRQFAQAGAVVVSGMARGCDAAANRGALRAGGITIGVLGCGVDICYPPEYRRLMDDIIATGAVVSEYPPGTPPYGSNFPPRNRIISGIAQALVVTEAGIPSGTYITTTHALEQGRMVFAVPGNIDAPNSLGTNRMIKEGAVPLTCAWDLLSEYQDLLPHKLDEKEFKRPCLPVKKPSPAEQDGKKKPFRFPFGKRKAPEQEEEETKAVTPKTLPEDLDEVQKGVMLAVLYGANTMDAIILQSGRAAPEAMAAITRLEIRGLIEKSGGLIRAAGTK